MNLAKLLNKRQVYELVKRGFDVVYLKDGLHVAATMDMQVGDLGLYDFYWRA